MLAIVLVFSVVIPMISGSVVGIVSLGVVVNHDSITRATRNMFIITVIMSFANTMILYNYEYFTEVVALVVIGDMFAIIIIVVIITIMRTRVEITNV